MRMSILTFNLNSNKASNAQYMKERLARTLREGEEALQYTYYLLQLRRKPYAAINT